jgi:hypothetical protein
LFYPLISVQADKSTAGLKPRPGAYSRDVRGAFIKKLYGLKTQIYQKYDFEILSNELIDKQQIAKLKNEHNPEF